MPFDPRLVGADESDDLQAEGLHEGSSLVEGLPAEMAELAGQLQADAQWLGELFPAATPKLPIAANASPRRRWARIAAALLLLAGGSIWLVQRQRAPEVAQPAIATNTAENATEVWATPTETDLPTTPVIFRLQEATGPELEGLLDMLEDDALAASMVSL